MTPPHLDDERLSAVLDGAGEAGDVAHLSSCADCGSRLEGWRRVARMVAALPAPAPGAARDAA
ncbi:MAG: hypothetical protein ACRDZ8_10530, partial [Acidimicrobiales bacterium]